MEEKKKIALDVDEVLLDFISPMKNFYNRRFGTNLESEDYIYYDLERVWGCTKLEAIGIVVDFYGSKEFREILPLNQAREVIDILSKKKELYAITSRPSSIEYATRECLNKFFGNVFSEIFLNGQYGVPSSGLDKSSYCLKNRIFVILEDNPDIAQKCANKNITTFLFDKPWNRHIFSHDKLIRVGEKRNPWEEVLECLV